MSIKSLALAIAKAFLDFILKPVLRFGWRAYYYSLDHTKPLPKTDNPLLFMPAWQLAQKIRKREITSLSLVQAYIDRIKELQPYLNFMVYDCFDEAIEQAKRVDEILSSSSSIPDAFSEARAPLLGIPFSCKESLWVKDKPNSTGLVKRKNFRAPEDAFVVKYMRQAGAIMTCMTNTSELCMWFETSNYLYGTTRNPYNLSRIVGGSSGGEGCIMGSGASVIGLGSDIGGSIRMPSYFNGVYGHMPTPNLISNDYQYPTGLQQAMLATGPICRYASDLKLMVKTLIGPKYSEIAHMFETKVEPKNLKFYVVRDLQGHLLVTEPDSDARKALDKAVKFIEEELGQKVEEIKPKLLSKAFEMWSSFVHEGKVGKRWFCRTLNNDPQNPINAFNQLLKSIIGQQREHTLPSILIALKEQLGIYEDEKYIKVGDQFREEMKELLGQNGVLIFPSFPSVAPYHNLAAFHNNFDFIYFGIINVLGFPSTQCPMGLNADGLPTGVQIVSNRFNDHITISLAELFEQKLGGWVAPF